MSNSKSGLFGDTLDQERDFNKNQYNIIVVNVRAFNLGSLNKRDAITAINGSIHSDIKSVDKLYLGDNLFPGILCEEHPEYDNIAFANLRESIHYFGFINEENYTENEMSEKILGLPNTNLVNEDNAINFRDIFAHSMK